MVESVREHVRLHFEALLHSLSVNRPITREDLMFIRPAATHRARGGVPVADFMHAFRIGQREIWRALAAGASDEETRDAALSVVEQVIEYVNLASTHAAEVYAEVEALLQAQGSGSGVIFSPSSSRDACPSPDLGSMRRATQASSRRRSAS